MSLLSFTNVDAPIAGGDLNNEIFSVTGGKVIANNVTSTLPGLVPAPITANRLFTVGGWVNYTPTAAPTALNKAYGLRRASVSLSANGAAVGFIFPTPTVINSHVEEYQVDTFYLVSGNGCTIALPSMPNGDVSNLMIGVPIIVKTLGTWTGNILITSPSGVLINNNSNSFTMIKGGTPGITRKFVWNGVYWVDQRDWQN